jgi:transcription elongation factor GreA
MNKIPMTSEGYSKLQDELKKLISEDRPNIIAAIAEARGHGDLSENAEYQYAKEQQSLIEGRISDLESTISRAEVIDIKSMTGEDIKFGATIEIEDDDTGTIHNYQIVGEYESDIENKKLSIISPLARGLIGKSKDDNVEINSPKGMKSYTIISVKYI